MTIVRVEWAGASESQRQRMRVHLDALTEAGAQVVEVGKDVSNDVQSAAKAILRYLASKRTAAGNAISQQDFLQLQLPSGFLNPVEQKSLWAAIEHLGDTGVLRQEGNKMFLTEAGERLLYA